MKISLCSLVLLFGSFSMAQNKPDDFSFTPSLVGGLGMEMNTGVNQADYVAFFATNFLAQVTDKRDGLGLKFLGFGLSLNDHGQLGLTASPAAFCLNDFCVLPSFIFLSPKKTNFGASLGYSF